MTDIYGFDQDGAKRLIGSLKEFERQWKNPISGRRTPSINGAEVSVFIEGVLDGDLFPPVDILTPTTATMSIYRFNGAGAFLDTGENLTVTNRDINAIGNTGDYCIVRYINGEYRPAGAQIGGGGANRDGIAVHVTSLSYVVGNDDGFVMVDGSGFVSGTTLTVTLPAGSAANEGHYVSISNIGNKNDVDVTADEFSGGGPVVRNLAIGQGLAVQSEGTLGTSTTGWYFVT